MLLIQIYWKYFQKVNHFSVNLATKSYNFKKGGFIELYNNILITDSCILIDFDNINESVDKFY